MARSTHFDRGRIADACPGSESSYAQRFQCGNVVRRLIWTRMKVYTYASRMYCSRCRLPISRHDGAITLYVGRGCGRFVPSPLNAGTTVFISWNTWHGSLRSYPMKIGMKFRNAVKAGVGRRSEV